MDFQKEANRIFVEEDGELLAEITFPVIGDYPCIDHTFVSDRLRGQGIAGRLVSTVAAQLKEQHQPFTVTCSYAIGWLERHEEYDAYWKR